MKAVKNNPKAYKRREIVAARESNRTNDGKSSSIKRFLDAPVSVDMYIDLGKRTVRKN